MTKTNFYLNACIAFAHNSGLIQEGFSDDYCVKLITGLAEKLTRRKLEKMPTLNQSLRCSIAKKKNQKKESFGFHVETNASHTVLP